MRWVHRLLAEATHQGWRAWGAWGLELRGEGMLCFLELYLKIDETDINPDPRRALG